MPISYLQSDSCVFPPVSQALKEPDGLLAIGGDLSPERLLMAYRNGIFPWFNQEDPILWWSPDPRAVLFPDRLHISRSMKRFLRHLPYRITLNHAFAAVIQHCAIARDETWITPDIQRAYIHMHMQGYAHSVEVWLENELVGGLYGIGMGQIFCGESMFSLYPNASKCALIAFCHYFTAHGGKLLDCQVLNSHTQSLGAENIPRESFIALLTRFQSIPLSASYEHRTLDSYAIS